MNELIARCSGSFTPTSTADFIGRNVIQHTHGDQTGAYLVAGQIEKAIDLATQNQHAPLKFLFNGRPGLGKSELVKFLQHRLGCNKWSTHKLNGTQCKIEAVEDVAASLHFKGLFGDWRLIWVDEADKIPTVAQVRFLTLLDDLPAGVVVACTSNCKLEDFEPRFQSRFQAFEIAPPPAEEIETFLQRLAPNLAGYARQIATFACGNVRQALLDAQGALQQMA